MTGQRYKNFPPGWNHLKIPTSSRRDALAGLALYAACRPRALLAQRMAWGWVKLFGPRALPGRAATWVPPVAAETWRELSEAWQARLGPFDAVAGYQRTQVDRPGLALLLLRRGRGLAFVKLRPGPSGPVDHEWLTLERVWRYGPRAFRVPEPLFRGTAGGWVYAAFAALPAELHRVPTDPPLDAILAEIRGALATTPRGGGVPAHWEPMHGDFAPWNLRQTSARALYLVDWEGAAWAPPGADAVYYHATSTALSGVPPARADDHREAVEFWRARLGGGDADARDRRLAASIRRALESMSG